MTGSELEYETNLIALLTLICQYLMPMWDAQTSHLGDKELHRLPRMGATVQRPSFWIFGDQKFSGRGRRGLLFWMRLHLAR